MYQGRAYFVMRSFIFKTTTLQRTGFKEQINLLLNKNNKRVQSNMQFLGNYLQITLCKSW